MRSLGRFWEEPEGVAARNGWTAASFGVAIATVGRFTHLDFLWSVGIAYIAACAVFLVWNLFVRVRKAV